MQALWMIVAAALFSVMGVCVKLAGPLYNTGEIVFYRGLVGLLFLTGMILIRGCKQPGGPVHAFKTTLWTSKIRMHFWRSLSGTLALLAWFFIIPRLPLATAVTLNYSAPLFVGCWIVYTAKQAGRKPSKTMITALACGFLGVLMLLQPTIARDQWVYGMIGIASAIMSTIAYLSVRALSLSGEPESRIVFYFCALNCSVGLIGALMFGFHGHTPYGLALVFGIGLTATLAQLAMTRAYGSGRALLTANLSFLNIVFSSIWGVLLFSDVIHLLSWIGMIVIIVSGVVATVYAARNPIARIAPLQR